MTYVTDPYRFGQDTWTYASLSAAESSGDPWADGNTIVITGGATFLYKSALEVSGHSGLIHKAPWSGVSSVEVASVTVNASAATNTDPDTWSHFDTDASAGFKTTDYDFDTNGGYCRLRDLTTSGRAYLRDTSNPTSNDTEIFLILDDLQVTANSSGGVAFWSAPAYVDGVNIANAYLLANTASGISTTNWLQNHTDGSTFNDTGFAFATRQRLWLYITDGKFAVWSNADSSPGSSGTTTRSGPAGDCLATYCGHTASAGTNTMELGFHIYGYMTTA